MAPAPPLDELALHELLLALEADYPWGADLDDWLVTLSPDVWALLIEAEAAEQAAAEAEAEWAAWLAEVEAP